jgi:CSLREA domain-containing protein/uncharacterized repeat protein (TIGR01451 family)
MMVYPKTFPHRLSQIISIVILLGGFLVQMPGTTADTAIEGIISVNTTADESGTGAACSLREAITAANNDSTFGGCPAGSGVDTINLPEGTYTLTQTNAGGLNEDANATGDLDILASLTIEGTGSALTFIQAGTNNTNGIDKVFGVNPFCNTGISVDIQDVTIRYGYNTQAYDVSDDSDFGFTGGGLDWCSGAGTGTFTLRNAVVSDNTNQNGWGGGVNVDSYADYTGAVTFDHVSFESNRTLNPDYSTDGGGLNVYCSKCNVVIDHSTFNGNTSANNGGGINYRPGYGGSLAIHASTFDVNTAGGYGGGIDLSSGNAGVTITIDQNTKVTNNSAGEYGGGINISGTATNTTPYELSNLLIRGNHADATGKAGGGICNWGMDAIIQYSRIVDNSADLAGSEGLYVWGGTVTAIENWWGCNTGPGGSCNGALLQYGTLTTSPYLKLRLTPDPATVNRGQPSTLTADFWVDSASNPVDSANLSALADTAVAWGVTNATLSGRQTTIQTDGTATASLTNNANCEDSSGSATVDNATATADVTLQCIDLTVTKTHTDPFYRGDVGDIYTITVTNSGSEATIGTITLVDSLPAGLTAIGLSGAGWDCTLATLTCTRSDALAGGGSYPDLTVTVDVSLTAAASVTNNVTVSGGGDTTPDNNTIGDLTNIPLLKYYLPLVQVTFIDP